MFSKRFGLETFGVKHRTTPEAKPLGGKDRDNRSSTEIVLVRKKSLPDVSIESGFIHSIPGWIRLASPAKKMACESPGSVLAKRKTARVHGRPSKNGYSLVYVTASHSCARPFSRTQEIRRKKKPIVFVR